MLYNRKYPVPKELQNLIQYYWSYDGDELGTFPLRIHSFADRFPRLIFQDIDNFAPIIAADGTNMTSCYLTGVDNMPSNSFWMSAFSHFGVSFQPHALHFFFRISADELTNRYIDISFFEKDLTEKLRTALTHMDRVSIMNKFFLNKLHGIKTDEMVFELLFTTNDEREKSLLTLLKQHRISERQLQRRFKQSVGLSMKNYEKILRFEKSLALLPHIKFGQLTSFAYELGYADQAHFINEFKSYSGLSPLQFLKKSALGAESASFIYPQV